MILAADLGTGSLKAGLLDPDGSLVARVRIPYRHAPGLDREDFDPRQWEEAFGEAIRSLPPARLSAIALSGNGPTLVPCSADGTPLADADLWLHRRSVHRPDVDSYYLPKAEWLRRNDHGTWRNTRLLLSCPEWLQFRLSGRPTMTLPHEGFRPYIWDDRQIEAYGLDRRLFPELVPMGSVAGRVRADATARYGLPEGLPIVACGSDFMMALLGSGAIQPGSVCDRAGTSEGINYCSEQPSGDPRLRDLPHVIAPYWNSAAILSSTGSVFEWYRRITGQENRPYDLMLAEVDAVPPGSGRPLFFPGSGPGALWEFGGGSFRHLDAGHGRAEMGRAVMEAIAFAVRRGVELLEEAGKPVMEMIVTGGQARGVVWNRMKADITGRRLLIPEIEDAELAGCACCAQTALGRFEHPAQAVGVFVRIRTVIDPDPRLVPVYDEAYERYRKISESGLSD